MHIQLSGKYAFAKVFTDKLEDEAIAQIERLLDQPFVENCKVRIMPDVHAGAGCVIGFTADLGGRVVPSLVGVDIACGIITVPLGAVDIDFRRLDKIIREEIPSGRNIHRERQVRFDRLKELYCYRNLKDTKAIERALGTLGGGNHFIEIDADDASNKYLLIHTGSRHFGLEVAQHYQKLAMDLMLGKDELFTQQKALIADYKAQGRRAEIQAAIKELNRNFQCKRSEIPNDLAFLFGDYRDMYLHDMAIAQEYAAFNRYLIAKTIVEELFSDCKVQFSSTGKIKIKQKGRIDTKDEWFDTVHNYIGEDNIIRKGAVAAYEGQKLVIPLNMRDGTLICIGRGNADWNYSAPHGAGRKMSRSKAEAELSLTEFAESMTGIYSTCINESTLDESPMAYKDKDDILNKIK